jgi:hypothetical protein
MFAQMHVCMYHMHVCMMAHVITWIYSHIKYTRIPTQTYTNTPTRIFNIRTCATTCTLPMLFVRD